jgi:hypothetical protein
MRSFRSIGEASGADRLRLDPAQLDGSPPNAATWDILRTTLNVPCVSGSLIGRPRIVSGDPADSEVYRLVDERGPLQMPPIASLRVDVPDVAVIEAWIRSMSVDAGGLSGDASAPDAGGQGGDDAGGMDGGFDSWTLDAGAFDGNEGSSDAMPGDTGSGGGDDSSGD